jgi:DNA-directed RNA polymerase subunit RPC12/RpoP
MPIVFHCEHCGKKISAPDNIGGQAGKCPNCHQRVFIPSAPDQLEEIPLAPEDPQDEIRRQKFLREQIKLQEELDKHKGAPEVPASQEHRPNETALPLDDDFSAASGASTSGPKVNQLIEQYILQMAKGNLDAAEELVEQIVSQGKKAAREVEQMAMQEFLHPAVAKVPATVIAGYFKKLLARFPH